MFTVDVLMSLDPSGPPSAPHSNDSTCVVIATGPAVPEQTDPSEVVIKKPMPLPTGTQGMGILNCIITIINQVRAS